MMFDEDTRKQHEGEEGASPDAAEEPLDPENDQNDDSEVGDDGNSDDRWE